MFVDERLQIEPDGGRDVKAGDIWRDLRGISGAKVYEEDVVTFFANQVCDEGVVVAESLTGLTPHINYDAIASVVYTWPEVAGVGKTEEQLKDAGTKYKSGKFPFTANSRARSNGESDGFVKILADAESDELLGCHIIGPAAGDLIMEVSVGMEFAASAEDIARTCHAHPQLGEAVKEAALAVDKRPIHM